MEETAAKALGKMVKAAREHRFPKQEAAAKALNISASYLWRIEEGKNTPGVEQARAIAELLDLDWDEVRGYLRQAWEEKLPTDLRFRPRAKDEYTLIAKFRLDPKFRDAVLTLMGKPK